MTDLNPTTRAYSRGLPTPAIEGPFKAEPKTSGAADFWVAMTLAFAAGYIVRLLWS
jgi:hypothetical protein